MIQLNEHYRGFNEGGDLNGKGYRDARPLEYSEMLKCIKQQKAALFLLFVCFLDMARVSGHRLKA